MVDDCLQRLGAEGDAYLPPDAPATVSGAPGDDVAVTAAGDGDGDGKTAALAEGL